MTEIETNDAARRLSKTLGLYKAEWLNEELYSLFDEPSYFDQLRTYRPCVLIGGRGTGKTTVLRGLSYEGQLALSGGVDAIEQWNYYGIYYRVNTNRVTAFRGGEISEDKWCAYFGHYINLSFCQLLLDFVEWFEKHTGKVVTIPKKGLRKITASLGIEEVSSINELIDEIEYNILDFEASINTIADSRPHKISALAAPLDVLADLLVSSEALSGKKFFFLIDEFENFEDYQQRVLNTIIKHANNHYTFKIGVRELGWRQRATLNPNEQLTSPADYARISIADWLNDSRFNVFAEKVVSRRIESAFPDVPDKISTPQNLLPSLSELDEAEILLGSEDKKQLIEALETGLAKEAALEAKKIRPAYLQFIRYLNKGINDKFYEDVNSWTLSSSEWRQKLDNHFHASLYSIKKGKRGIRKHYCGWDTFVSLANGNIRYLLV
ncbi:ORC-CDC6 family AAA ATPase [Rheinheimera oceanensis]|uniref:ORC-CDC6 family AAA ATPase n=1 Tax=Rheinheimera oceanensis TaxID=2817449 RepID=UPI001BFD13FC|nr:hypothetical protein [Rheinheimera oceanensis]